jgi:uncharacterized coiled-coil protein SlyX
MDKMQADLVELVMQGAETSSTIKQLNDSLKVLSSWMSQMDKPVRSLQNMVEEVGA